MTHDLKSVSTAPDEATAHASSVDRLMANHARKLARQRARRQEEVRIDYRPGLAAQQVLRHYQRHGLTLDAIIDSLVLTVGVRPVAGSPETFRKPK